MITNKFILQLFNASYIAIIGGGRFCRELLEVLLEGVFSNSGLQVIGVADSDDNAEGLKYAESKGIYVTDNFRELFELPQLQAVLDLTPDISKREIIFKSKPVHIRLIDYVEARSIWSQLEIENEKLTFLDQIQKSNLVDNQLVERIQNYTDRIATILAHRNRRYQALERGMIRSEQTMSQIIQGSTIPMFIINKDHIITHWNKACERLTGYTADELVGTDNQWRPFRLKKRPTMADLILDGASEKEVLHYYDTHWKKSVLIEGAYEAEEYFPNLGKDGKWLFFTAAPIKMIDGTIIGAIETLWDKSADKLAEEQMGRYAQELVERERALAQIIQGSTIPTFVVDKNHIITHWNKALEVFTGYSSKEMVGTRNQWIPFWEEKRPSMADVIIDQIKDDEVKRFYGAKWRKSALIEGAYEAELFFPKLGENGRWCFFTAAPIKAPDGTIIGAIETFQDTTEDKKVEEERERHTRELSALVSIYTELSASGDIEQRVQAAIGEVGRFLKADSVCIYLLDSNDNLMLSYQNQFSDKQGQQQKQAGEDSIIYHVAHTGEFTVYDELPQGCSEEVCFLELGAIQSVAYVPLSSKAGSTFGVIRLGSNRKGHFSQDVKDILQIIGNRIGVAMENALLQKQSIKSEEKYRTLFNNAPNSVFILDNNNFKIIDTNQRTLENYGYEREDLINKSFLALGDDDDSEIQAGLNNLRKGQSLLFAKKKHYRKGGQAVYVTINASHTQYGEQDVLIVSTIDISESIEKETQLIQASKMTTLGQMAAGIAHEINQPLNVIQVCADLLLKMMRKGAQMDAGQLTSLANDIGRNVQRASNIIKHMRDFARQSEVVRNKININEPIKDVFAVLGHQVKSHQIDLVLELADDLPPILAEHNRLEQVFVNMVTNAIDAMDEKSTDENCKEYEKKMIIRTFTDSGKVVATVTDTGIGIAPEIRDKIFEPFFTTKDVGKGTGLGVSISYGIIKDYDGEILIDSRVGEGTTFVLRFPAMTS
ncbi:MAG: PAS domain S-box protein [Desulfobacteraceae bacterium]|jgi:PAS domain S-box-containing protein